MKFKKITWLLLGGLMATAALAGCNKKNNKQPSKEQTPSGDQGGQQGGDQGGEQGGGGGQQVNSYTITFKNYDETVLETKSVEEGQMPAYTGQVPTKAADAQYTYTFDGWEPEIAAASADATYTAKFASTVNQYTIRFENEDGTLLETKQVAYGEVPTYTGEEPEKAATADKVYEFADWIPQLTAVTGDATYVASFNDSVRKYTITFVDADGTVLQEGEVEYGNVPEYTGSQPSKASTVDTVYTYEGWDKPLEPVSGDETYTAVYSTSTRQYTIKFVNEDGSELQSDEVDYGAMPSYTGSTPEKDADEHYTYEFAGWDEEIAAVDGDKTYTAEYNGWITPLDVNGDYDFTAWKFGAGEFCGEDDRSWGMPAAEDHVMKYKVWNQDTFELRLPRIDFSANPEVSMTFEGTNYHGRVTLGLDANDVTHKDGVESNRDIVGTLMFVLDGGKLYEQLIFGSIVINNVIEDQAIIKGRKSVSIYVGALFDRFFNVYNITFSRENFVGQTFDLTNSYAGAFMKNNGSDITWNLGSDRAVGDVHYTSNADHLMYYIYDTNTFECGLPKVNFIFNKAVTMDIYAPNWNSGAKLGLLENDINYSSGNGDSVVNGQLAFVYTEGKLLGILDFGTTHQVFDVTDNDVILGNKNPVLWAKAYYGRVILVSNIEVHPDGEFQMKHDWSVDKLGAAMYKDGGDVTWGFGTYTTSSVLGYKVWDTSMFKFVMPKINYSLTKKVTFVFHSTVWQAGVKFGLVEDDVNYSTSKGAVDGNISDLDGTLVVENVGESLSITLTLGDTSVGLDGVTDASIMNGTASVNMFVKALYDRNLMLNQIKLAF